MKKHCPCIPVLTKIFHEELVSISLFPCNIMYVLQVSLRPFCFYSQRIRISVSVCFLKDDLAVPVILYFFFIAEGVILDSRTFDWVSFLQYSIILFPYLGFLSKMLIADGVCDIPVELMLTASENIELEMVS